MVKKIKFYKPIINYGDYQKRICKVKNNIRWGGIVHETLIGDETINLPINMDLDLLHHKTISKQESQNNFYNGL